MRGAPCPSAISRATRQKVGSSVLDSCQARTDRLYQSMIATNYMKSWARRTYVISALQTWWGRLRTTACSRYGEILWSWAAALGRGLG
jgi:hypothetical protein